MTNVIDTTRFLAARREVRRIACANRTTREVGGILTKELVRAILEERWAAEQLPGGVDVKDRLFPPIPS